MCLICGNSDATANAFLTPLTSEALIARRVVSAPVELNLGEEWLKMSVTEASLSASFQPRTV